MVKTKNKKKHYTLNKINQIIVILYMQRLSDFPNKKLEIWM